MAKLSSKTGKGKNAKSLANLKNTKKEDVSNDTINKMADKASFYLKKINKEDADYNANYHQSMFNSAANILVKDVVKNNSELIDKEYERLKSLKLNKNEDITKTKIQDSFAYLKALEKLTNVGKKIKPFHEIPFNMRNSLVKVTMGSGQEMRLLDRNHTESTSLFTARVINKQDKMVSIEIQVDKRKPFFTHKYINDVIAHQFSPDYVITKKRK